MSSQICSNLAPDSPMLEAQTGPFALDGTLH